MNKLFQRKIIATLFCLFFVVSSFGCSSDKNADTQLVPTPNPSGPVVASIGELKTFLSERAASCQYCRNYTVKNGYFEIRCLGNHMCTIKKEKTVLLTIGDDGCWTADGISTGKPVEEATARLHAPSVGLSASGDLVVNGINLGIKAGGALRCIADVKKHLYFCFPEGVATLGCEKYGNYNPILPIGRKTLRILFIGNSFTVDATEHLPGILKAAGIDQIELVRVYHGGYTLPEYSKNYATNKICARHDSPQGSGVWKGDNTLDTSLETVLREAGPFDIVTLQEHSGKSYAWEWTSVFHNALGDLIDKIQTLQPTNRPSIVYLMSQVYGVGSTILTKNFENDQARMFETLTTQVKHILANTSIDYVIPSGTSLENLRTTHVNAKNGMDLTRDSYHMDFGISRFAAACTVFQTIITPCTGKSVAGNTYRYDKANTASPNYSTPVTNANAPIAIRAAIAASEEPFQVTQFD